MNLSVELRIPEANEFLSLRKRVGWPLFAEDITRKALAHSLFAVCIMDEGKIVGMGRILGDNVIYFHIQDVVVDPEYQRSGVGKLIMRELMKYVEINAGTNANIGLMCSKGREEFYEGFGFLRRPAEKFGAGMICIIE